MATVQHANFIEYGRRGPRGGAQSNKKSFHPELFGKSKTVSSMRGVKILQQKEFDRIQSSLTAKEVMRKELDVKEKEKQRLKELSRKQISTWSNTIAGQHKAKLEAKKLREEREAVIRHEEDIKEGIYQAEKRRKAIEHAKRLTFNKSDRVKKFHGALILTEVLKEREAQLALKKRREAARNQKERSDWEATLEEILEAKNQEAQNEVSRRVAKKETQKYQLEQVARKYAKEHGFIEDEKNTEAELIVKDLSEYHKEHEMKKEQVAQKKLRMKDSYFAHLEEKKKLVKRAKDIEEAETREVQIFRDYKLRVDAIKKEKLRSEWARDEAKTKRNEEHFLKIKAETEGANDAQFKKMRDQKMAEQEAKIEAKERKRRQNLLDTLASQQALMKQHEDERKQQLDDELKEQLEKFAEDRNWHEGECARAEERRKAARKVLDFNKDVAKSKVHGEKANRESDLNFDRGIIMKNVEDESIFQKYAKEVIDEAIEKERNPYALQRVADTGNGGGRGPKFEGIGGLRPSYLTSTSGGHQLPSQITSKNATRERLVKPLHIAKKRLGFSHW
ncbi:unnamed protein product [Oikopleura dioica]|uniref:Trichohyalin-plectin-homology domain-containing protein n=1 Tax=Oikopleura dioica TaxID=34765 RepID=E4YFS5_OIKDI|nr:unnamed protein product [Oikopleura dioica]